jgi:hypothetical protein
VVGIAVNTGGGGCGLGRLIQQLGPRRSLRWIWYRRTRISFVSCVVCRVSCVVCRVSCVVCRVSCVVCRVSCRSMRYRGG